MADTTSAQQPRNCPYCGTLSLVGSVHPVTRCPAVNAVEFHPNGSIKRVELVR